MSKPLDALREAGFFNPSMVLTGYATATGAEMPVAILYQPQERGRITSQAGWVIYRPGFKTDPREGTDRWWEHGRKTFTINRANPKPARLEEAKAWATNRYGVDVWASVPGFRDDKFPAEVVSWLKRELKEHPVAKPQTAEPTAVPARPLTTPARPPRTAKTAPAYAHTPQRAKPSIRSTS